jgi:hypothetical protein
VRGLHVAEKHAGVDPLRDVGVAFSEMPGELAERSTIGVRAEVVFLLRQAR